MPIQTHDEVGAQNFFYRVGALHATSLQLALVLIPKSMPTELSVLGNTSSKTSTTKLRKYRLAESLITVFLT